MLFNSVAFAVFLPVVFVMYWFVCQTSLRRQNVFLLVASYVFYGYWDWRFLSLLALSSGIDYLCGLAIYTSSAEKKRTIFLSISLLANLGLLGVFKYFNFFAESFSRAFSAFGYTFDAVTLNVVLPVGISFYTFQTLSYTLDIYRRKAEPTKDIIAFFTYVSFFPQLVAGPIERAADLLPQFFTRRAFTYEQGVAGMRLIGWGLLKKVVIADGCAVFVNQIFANHATLPGLVLCLGAVYFAFQIYGDFSGYSDIAIGTAQLFGFQLRENFRTPYFARDIAEFWRRWHISLSTWFRDYLYIPLGGSRVTRWRIVRNTVVIFLVSGLWHGANWTFILWGALHAAYFLPSLLRGSNRTHLDDVAQHRTFPSARELWQMVRTFGLTCFAWIFFRAASLEEAGHYVQGIFVRFGDVTNLDAYLPKKLLGLLVLFVLVDWLQREEGFSHMVCKLRAVPVRWAFYFALFLLVLLFGQFHQNTFIYFQF